MSTKVEFDKRITLDAMHNEMLKTFKKNYDSIPLKYTELNNLINEYNKLKNINNKNLTQEFFDLRFELKNKIKNLDAEIKGIMNKSDINNYYLNVGEILHSYYENINIVANNKKKNINNDIFTNKNGNSSENSENLNILDFFNSKNNNDNDNDNDNENENENENENDCLLGENYNNNDKNEEEYENENEGENSDSDIDENTDDIKKYKNLTFTSTKISDFVETSLDFKKTDIVDNYLNYIDPTYISKLKIDNTIDKCPKPECNSTEMIIIPSEGIQICENCGLQISILIESDKPSFKDPPPEISYFAYKRINHFNEWLAQFQAKESTEIPQEVYDLILLEIKKERIINLANLTNNKIRNYLKKLKLNKYYEHIPHILNRLNGLPPPIMCKQTEEKLRVMFKEIQSPFMEVCPKNRKNFLSYSYVLHKFVELLGLDHYKSAFPLLKSREKLHQQDMIWKDICKILNWHFIKSI